MYTQNSLPSHHVPKERSRSLFPFVLFALASFLIGGISGGAVAFYVVETSLSSVVTVNASVNSQKDDTNAAVLNVSEDSAAVSVAEAVSPSVVSIVISKELENIIRQGPFFFQTEGSGEFEDVGGGTGFFATDDGLILTNRHVVSDDQAQYFVVLHDGRRFPVEILSIDPLNDLAIIRVATDEKIDFQPLELGDSDLLKVGQSVLAVGNTLAEYQNSVTKGVISGIEREIVAGSFQEQELLNDVIQTDAAINPGNSGGPLLNLAGQVVGINTAIDQQGQGIGFAIPVNQAKKALGSFRKFGKITYPMLGVRYMPVTEEVAKERKLPVTSGALILSSNQGESAVVSGGPAEAAGLAEGDIILAINGTNIDSEHPLSDLIQSYEVGDTVKVRYIRGSEEHEADVTLTEFK